MTVPPSGDRNRHDALDDADALLTVDRDQYGRPIGVHLRDEGVALAESAGDDWDRRVIDRAIAETGRRLRRLSANDVRPLLPEVRRSLIGARFLALAKQGRLRPVGYVPSTDPGTHGSPVRLWQWVG